MDISELLNKFTSDPAAAKAAAELAAKLMEGAQKEAAPQSESTPEPQKSEDMLSQILSNPEFMQKMPQMLSAVAPMLQGAAQNQAPQSLPKQSAPIPTGEQAKRTALLLALKPYLTPERAESVDHIIRLTGLIELFSLLK